MFVQAAQNLKPGAVADLVRSGAGFHVLKVVEKREAGLPGMTVTAEIVVGKRSVLSYLLWPLTKALNESIREP